jgi:hypothetical protein
VCAHHKVDSQVNKDNQFNTIVILYCKLIGQFVLAPTWYFPAVLNVILVLFTRLLCILLVSNISVSRAIIVGVFGVPGAVVGTLLVSFTDKSAHNPPEAGVCRVPSHLQNVVALAPVHAFKFATGKLPVTSLARFTCACVEYTPAVDFTNHVPVALLIVLPSTHENNAISLSTDTHCQSTLFVNVV